MKSELKTRGLLPGYFFEFIGDDENCIEPVLIEVTEVQVEQKADEIEIQWSIDKFSHYLRFRLRDLRRAAREVTEKQSEASS